MTHTKAAVDCGVVKNCVRGMRLESVEATETAGAVCKQSELCYYKRGAAGVDINALVRRPTHTHTKACVCVCACEW